jgi:hypothetical protein
MVFYLTSSEIFQQVSQNLFNIFNIDACLKQIVGNLVLSASVGFA